MTPRHIARIASGLAIATALTALAGPATAQTIDPGPIVGPQPQPITSVPPCSESSSILPTSARPGATAAPVSVNVPAGGSTTATFTVATAQAATALGTDGFTLRPQSLNAPTQTQSLDVRVLPDEGAFSGLSWQTGDSTCGTTEADVTGTNITFDGPGFAQTQAHTLLRYAWTPDCKTSPATAVRRRSTAAISRIRTAAS